MGIYLVTCIRLHLLGLKYIPHSRSHSSSASISLERLTVLVWGNWPVDYAVFRKEVTLGFDTFWHVVIWMLKTVLVQGPSLGGTPEVTEAEVDFSPSTTTYWVLSLRSDWSMQGCCLLFHSALAFANMRSWDYFACLRKNPLWHGQTGLPSHTSRARSSTNCSSWVSQDLVCWKPCWRLLTVSILLPSKFFIITCASVRQRK